MTRTQEIRNLVVGAAVLATTAAGAASANTFHYDFTSASPFGPSPAPSLSCDAFGNENDNCTVTITSAGLGVNGFSDLPDTTPNDLDGFPKNSGETLTIDFGFDRAWDEISFGNWDFLLDDVTLSGDFGSFDWGPLAASTAPLGGAVSSYLSITAASGGGFFGGLDSLTDFLTVESIKVSSVPLPAAGWMLLAGLGGIAAMRRRQKS